MTKSDTFNQLFPQWKKQAAQQFPDEQVEMEFMNQAYAFIQNKAGRLLTDPHRLGFEIVHKNDNRTRMVGIFAFRAHDKLLYVPCFFLSGDIKGTDLLYQHDRKQMCPLTEEWVEYLVKTFAVEQGKGIPQTDAQNRKRMDIRGMMMPPTGRGLYAKMASEQGLPSAQDIFEELRETRELGPILTRFIDEDGGNLAVDMLVKGASENMEVARAMCDLDVSTWVRPQQVKQASAEEPVLTLFTGGFGEGIKEASTREGLFKRGYSLLDSRPQDVLNPVMIDDCQNLEILSEPGMYRVLTVEEGLKPGFAVRSKCLYLASNPGFDNLETPATSVLGYASGRFDDDTDRDMFVIYQDGTRSNAGRAMGTTMNEEGDEEVEDADYPDTPSTGKTYVIFDPNTKRVTQPYKVKRVKETNGITLVDLEEACWGGCEYQVKINPDLRGFNCSENLAGEGVKWIPVKMERDDGCNKWSHGTRLGDEDTFNRWLKDENLVKSSAYRVDGGYRLIVDDTQRTPVIGERTLLVKLARDLRIHGETAQALVDALKTRSRVDFLVKGASIRLLDKEDFEDDFDDDYGVAVDRGNAQVLETTRPMEELPAPRIGDAVDPVGWTGASREMLMNEAPEMLAQFSKMNQVPNLFEHGLVGSLTNAFNVVALVDRYLPDMEKALDVMGRTLFLLYWKPGEFQDAYGVDDMQDMEDEVLSNFLRYGEMVLKLLKKSKAHKGLSTSFTQG